MALLVIPGCGSSAEDVSKERLTQMAGGPLKEVVPVSGKVSVDGEPKAGVKLHLYPAAGGEKITESLTKADGTYCWATYTPCDGLPAGSYKIAFQLFPKQRRNDTISNADDLFKGRYNDPVKSEFTLTVEKGKPQTDANYELKMK
ncbi:MAG TPA: hypothetical protein VL475_03820 [Planctomycetaceae bacterium]|nr:hypothetical protein [Planctomycetaceae bacterium]